MFQVAIRSLIHMKQTFRRARDYGSVSCAENFRIAIFPEVLVFRKKDSSIFLRSELVPIEQHKLQSQFFRQSTF